MLKNSVGEFNLPELAKEKNSDPIGPTIGSSAPHRSALIPAERKSGGHVIPHTNSIFADSTAEHQPQAL